MGAHEILAAAWADRRKRYVLTAGITLVALFAVVATIVATVRSQNSSTDSTVFAPTIDHAEGGTQGSVKAPSSGPTPEPPSTLSGEVSTSSPAPLSPNAIHGGSSTTPTPTPPPNLVYTCSAMDPTSVCYIPPTNSPLYCSLDKAIDPNLVYIAAPSVGNTNAGFAMEQQCASGDRCTYGCEPPFVASSNGWNNADCIPYLSLCPPYSASTARGGLYCDKGRLILDSPSQPLCVPGLNTSFVTNNVPAIMSTCQRVTPGNGAPMIGLEAGPGQTKQLAVFPQWYWRGVSAQHVVHLPGTRRIAACQRNADPLSMNAQGIDAMPFFLGGGSLPGSACAACAQHSLAFNEHFDFRKAYSKVPGYGVRVRNCNDVTCGPVQCDATYVYNAASDTLDAYWVKYNTVFGPTAAGCIADVVVGQGWTSRDGTSKYTLYEYYPTSASGQQAASCSGCSPAPTFDATRCSKIRQPLAAKFGSGVSPAQYVCTPVGAAVGMAGTLTVLSATSTNDASKTGWLTATVQIEIFVACVLAVIVVVAVMRARRIPAASNTSAADTVILEPQPLTELPMQWTPDRRGSMHVNRTTYVARSSTTFEPHPDVSED
ncbi:hypothetical protein H310_01678 [Aphanomyces invadans]|uniref:Uncharacterized protein n=1 Tax=Aphanomyces invadans TaxID=157072 RepID=A0A024UTJ4_9STRA|nr:hypothetical protein H310_01678 [Aphanomyces invadans]ETW09285.1 hypothetical protein H310_01678 [Aphanomyces invadans]|eukprot:XP_008863090.1 hypothetical protein H310_01678 [Aphanomyces invadans]